MNEHLKDHFVSLLLEEYKLTSFIYKLMSLGVNLDRLEVQNHHIVLDIIGFPRDNYSDMTSAELNSDKLPDDYFCRDWLGDRFYEVITEHSEKQEVLLTDKGLSLKEGADELIVRQAISEHVDWLFEEYSNLDNNEP
jgi:hypothetical protein